MTHAMAAIDMEGGRNEDTQTLYLGLVPWKDWALDLAALAANAVFSTVSCLVLAESCNLLGLDLLI